tara:strand:+ start:22540 stop:22926 length:387 start_codon:yes stop_codon:yes gene_type:complete
MASNFPKHTTNGLSPSPLSVVDANARARGFGQSSSSRSRLVRERSLSRDAPSSSVAGATADIDDIDAPRLGIPSARASAIAHRLHRRVQDVPTRSLARHRASTLARATTTGDMARASRCRGASAESRA